MGAFFFYDNSIDYCLLYIYKKTYNNETVI